MNEVTLHRITTTARWHHLKMRALFWGPELTVMYRKVSQAECRLVVMRDNGTLYATGPVFWMNKHDMVHFQTREQYRDAVKYAKERSPKQKAVQAGWQQLGQLTRTQANLRNIVDDHSTRLNLVQLKKVDDARMILSWIVKQVRHDLATLKNIK